MISLSVSTSNLQINSQAQYSFFWNRQLNPLTFEYTPNPSSVPLNSVLVINFPSQFLSVSSSSALPCSSDSGTALTCTVNSASKQIIITDYYLTSATQTAGSFTITIKNIQNAYKSGASDQFGYSIVSPTGTTIDEGPPTSSTASGTSLTFVPGSFPSNLPII